MGGRYRHPSVSLLTLCFSSYLTRFASHFISSPPLFPVSSPPDSPLWRPLLLTHLPSLSSPSDPLLRYLLLLIPFLYALCALYLEGLVSYVEEDNGKLRRVGGFSHLSFFHFLGKMLGKALHEVRLLLLYSCSFLSVPLFLFLSSFMIIIVPFPFGFCVGSVSCELVQQFPFIPSLPFFLLSSAWMFLLE